MDKFKQPLPELVTLRDQMILASKNAELIVDKAYLKFF